MVLRHFKLREQPFGVTPDPRYLYASATHREALSSILYGIESGLGFVTLTAKPGMGKTTLLFEALRRLQDTTRTVFLFQTISTPSDLLQALLMDLGVKDLSGTFIGMQAQLNEVLVAQSETNQRLVVAIDEAQNLDESVLEAVRMLSNFETSRHKLMQIVLCGQLQLAEKLELPQLLQLRQRISIFGHLKPLTQEETGAYIEHRLRVAGHFSEEPIFTPEAMALVAKYSEGIPRNINNICFNALSLGTALQVKTIDVNSIREVAIDLKLEPPLSEAFSKRPSERSSPSFAVLGLAGSREAGEEQTHSRPLWRKLSFAVAVLVALGIIGWLAMIDYQALKERGTDAGARVDQKINVPPAVADIGTEPVPQTAIKKSSPAQAETAQTEMAQPDTYSAEKKTPAAISRVVRVQSGQSLHGICEQSFAKCTPDVFRQIVRMNGSISNPNHIEAGQKVAIPIVPESATGAK